MEPRVFVAAIEKLGYKAKPSTLSPAKTGAATRPVQFRVPADAPPFFVEAIKRARSAKQPVVIDFWAGWCAACLQLKHETLEHPDVVQALRSVEMIYVDLDEHPALGDAYDVVAIPDVLFVDRSGRIVDRLHKFEPPDAFVARIQKVVGQVSKDDRVPK